MRELVSQGADEIIIGDDGDNGSSLDDAAELGVRVVTVPEVPEGWVGKNWACWQLANAATGDLVVFADADTEWAPGALESIVAERERLEADLLSVLPRTTGVKGGARLLTPLVEVAVTTMVPWPLLAWDRLGRGVSCGALMVMTREDHLRRGHGAVPQALQDDIVIARLVQRSGGRVRLVLGGHLLGVRSYSSYVDSVQGMGKSAVAVSEDSRLLALGLLTTYVACHTLPWLVPASPVMWAVRVATVLDRPIVNLVVGRRSPADLAEGLLGPITPVAAIPVLVTGLRRRLVWKGRSYPATCTSYPATPAPGSTPVHPQSRTMNPSC